MMGAVCTGSRCLQGSRAVPASHAVKSTAASPPRTLGGMLSTSRQMRPCASMFGWYTGVLNCTLGGSNGYLHGVQRGSWWSLYCTAAAASRCCARRAAADLPLWHADLQPEQALLVRRVGRTLHLHLQLGRAVLVTGPRRDAGRGRLCQPLDLLLYPRRHGWCSCCLKPDWGGSLGTGTNFEPAEPCKDLTVPSNSHCCRLLGSAVVVCCGSLLHPDSIKRSNSNAICCCSIAVQFVVSVRFAPSITPQTAPGPVHHRTKDGIDAPESWCGGASHGPCSPPRQDGTMFPIGCGPAASAQACGSQRGGWSAAQQ